MSADVYGETRNTLSSYMEEILRDAVTYTEHARRRTVLPIDVATSLKSKGKVIYGFSG